MRGRSRYGVKRVRDGAGCYGSRAERDRAAQLRLMEKAGLIRDLRFQVRFPLKVNGVTIETYIADAVYYDRETGEFCIEDTKNGLLTDTFKRKAKWMAALGQPVTIHNAKAARRTPRRTAAGG